MAYGTGFYFCKAKPPTCFGLPGKSLPEFSVSYNIRDQQPALILGDDLISFLAARRPQKQSCKLDECYCFSCRAPRPAAGRMADVTTNGTTTGNLRALCATCLTVMHKRLSVSKIPELQRLLDVTITQAAPRLSQRLSPCLNDHSSHEGKTHA